MYFTESFGHTLSTRIFEDITRFWGFFFVLIRLQPSFFCTDREQLSLEQEYSQEILPKPLWIWSMIYVIHMQYALFYSKRDNAKMYFVSIATIIIYLHIMPSKTIVNL